MNHRRRFALLLATVALAASPAVRAQTTIAAWNFDNLANGSTSLNPAASTDVTGTASASSVGMTSTGTANYPTAGATGPDTSNINKEAGTDTSAGNVNTGANNEDWRIVGTNGWNTAAAIGTQGAQFNVSTAGFASVALTFDIEITSQGEADLQVQYTTNGTSWQNALISYTPASNPTATANVLNNPASGGNPSIVTGYYLATGTSSGNNQWFNQITANLSGISNVSNDPNFGIRIVNAATGTSDVAEKANTVINNTSGNWRLDDVTIAGTAIPEPSTWALIIGCAALAVAFLRRRRGAYSR